MAEFDLTLVGGNFPPGLNTASPPTLITRRGDAGLSVDETPDGYGYDITKDGVLATGTVPTGTARIADTESISGSTWYWHYRRLWRASTTTLYVGAPDYKDIYNPQGKGFFEFTEDAQSIIGFIPFGQDNMAVFKSTGMYVISNIADTRQFWSISDIKQELGAASITYATELDGTLYVCNALGLSSYKSDETTELTRKVRDALTNFVSTALTVNYVKKWIIGGSAFVYDTTTGKLFRWSSTAFRYTSPQWHLPDYRPVSPRRLLFAIEHADSNGGSLRYQTRREDGEWTDDFDVDCQFQTGDNTVVADDLDDISNTRRFQIRLTYLSSNIYVKEIRLELDNSLGMDDYAGDGT